MVTPRRRGLRTAGVRVAVLSWAVCGLACEPGVLTREGDIALVDAGPRTDAPGTDAPGVDAPGVDAPGVDAPGALDGGVDGGPDDPCLGVACDPGAMCVAGECVCREGFVDDGSGCVAPPAGDPATRSMSDVCDGWNAGHVTNASPEWMDDGLTCGPGVMARAGIDDTLRRINMYRWLAGMTPVVDDPARHAGMMECAAMMSVNAMLSHSPPMSWTCYTAAGATAASRANIALGYGSSPAAINGYMRDRNVDSLGHRRWILSSRLASVGIGFSSTGSRPGQCLGVIGGTGAATERPWSSYPNQGFAPMETALDVWSFQPYAMSLTGSSAGSIVRTSDGADMPVLSERQPSGGSVDAVKMTPMGWMPVAGETYRVTITDLSTGELSYEVTPVDC